MLPVSLLKLKNSKTLLGAFCSKTDVLTVRCPSFKYVKAAGIEEKGQTEENRREHQKGE